MAEVQTKIVTCDVCKAYFEQNKSRLIVRKIDGNVMNRIDFCPKCEAELVNYIDRLKIQSRSGGAK